MSPLFKTGILSSARANELNNPFVDPVCRWQFNGMSLATGRWSES